MDVAIVGAALEKEVGTILGSKKTSFGDPVDGSADTDSATVLGILVGENIIIEVSVGI